MGRERDHMEDELPAAGSIPGEGDNPNVEVNCVEVHMQGERNGLGFDGGPVILQDLYILIFCFLINVIIWNCNGTTSRAFDCTLKDI